MTNEEFEKRMEFILEQQAQFTSDIQQLRESQAQTEQLVNRFAAVTLEGFKELTEKVSAVINAQIRTEQNVSSLALKVAELTEAQAHTDRRLNVIIDIINEGRNGKSQK